MADKIPERVVETPLTLPRNPLGIALPNTSFELMEENARAREKVAKAMRTTKPAGPGGRSNAASPMDAMHAACAMALPTTTHLRRLIRLTQPEIKSCGSIDPDSRIGTSIPMKKPLVPSWESNHVSTVFGLVSTSPMRVHVWVAMMAAALFFWERLSPRLQWTWVSHTLIEKFLNPYQRHEVLNFHLR